MDENIRPFRYRPADLVAITAFTTTVSRAYEIAEIYRREGTPVVIGGIHASMLPQEAMQYADAVVVGEAESVWPQILKDFENGRLQPLYKAPPADLTRMPAPRHDIFHPSYLFASIQTSRGCPMDCDFCSVPAFNGHRYRLRPVEAILEEMSSVRNRLIYFVDDNIVGYNEKAREHAALLFEGMIRKGLRKEWFAQASLNIAQDPELLKLAARSGCKMLLIGIEAESEDALNDTNKRLNLKLGVDKYARSFRTIHKAGIAVLGAFIYGMDSDTQESLHKRTKFILRSSVDVVQASAMTPLPGTRLFDRMRKENRLLSHSFPQHWQHFHFTDVVFRPKQMEPEALAAEMNRVYHSICSMTTLRIKFLRTLWNTRSLRTAVWAWNSNLNYRMVAFEKSSVALNPFKP
ncbi:MAG: B12-binding domain-containing radical SAM protein [Bacteroidales bacterium]